jgi:hypothetical protein
MARLAGGWADSGAYALRALASQPVVSRLRATTHHDRERVPQGWRISVRSVRENF